MNSALDSMCVCVCLYFAMIFRVLLINTNQYHAWLGFLWGHPVGLCKGKRHLLTGCANQKTLENIRQTQNIMESNSNLIASCIANSRASELTD